MIQLFPSYKQTNRCFQMQPSKPKQQEILKSAPDPIRARSAAMPPPPAAAKPVPIAMGQKGMPPSGPPPKVPPVKNIPTATPAKSATEKQQESTSGPQPDLLPVTRFTGSRFDAPSSPKGTSTAQARSHIVSPRGQPPPRVAHPPRLTSTATVADSGACAPTPKSVATDDTEALEEKLRKKRDAKRPHPEQRREDQQYEEDRSKHHRTRHHKREEERHSDRDTRRSRRTSKEQSYLIRRELRWGQ